MGEAKRPPLSKMSLIHLAMMKFLTNIAYLNKIQKIY